jgi:hypothetical protein
MISRVLLPAQKQLEKCLDCELLAMENFCVIKRFSEKATPGGFPIVDNYSRERFYIRGTNV